MARGRRDGQVPEEKGRTGPMGLLVKKQRTAFTTKEGVQSPHCSETQKWRVT